MLAKQVPDTRNVGKDAMKADGTVNRGALPAIFNPEDLHALEQGLHIKERYPDSTVTIITMGPGRAAEIIREGLYRGADAGYLLTDRAFAGSDTLATSYALSKAIEYLGKYDIIIAGRQAIDGDTAQVGPQVAQKLNIPQITYVEKITDIKKNKIQAKRRLERGVETVECSLPILMTITGTAAECRPRNSKRVMKYKHAKTTTESQDDSEDYIALYNERPYLTINELSASDVKADVKLLGISGSPTKVKKIENVVFKAKETKKLSDQDGDIDALMKELIENHTIG